MVRQCWPRESLVGVARACAARAHAARVCRVRGVCSVRGACGVCWCPHASVVSVHEQACAGWELVRVDVM